MKATCSPPPSGKHEERCDETPVASSPKNIKRIRWVRHLVEQTRQSVTAQVSILFWEPRAGDLDQTIRAELHRFEKKNTHTGAPPHRITLCTCTALNKPECLLASRAPRLQWCRRQPYPNRQHVKWRNSCCCCCNLLKRSLHSATTPASVGRVISVVNAFFCYMYLALRVQVNHTRVLAEASQASRQARLRGHHEAGLSFADPCGSH